MKWITVILITSTAILTILYLAIGGIALAIALGTIGLTAIIVSVFSLGIWYAHKSIQLGARLAIEAQTNNDKWDTTKMQALANFGNEIFKLKDRNNSNPLPLLEFGGEIENSAIDAMFTIQGISDNEGVLE